MGDTNKDGDARVAEHKAKLSRGFQGEEDLEGVSTPQKDMVAAAFLALFSIAAIVLALRMPNPGNVYTAPGLLPLLTAGSLLLMAIGLAVRALREGVAQESLTRLRLDQTAAAKEDRWRAGILIALLVLLVVLVDMVTFDISIPVGGFEFRVGSFECMTIPVLTVILRLFWRAATWKCLLVSSIAVFALATAFRYGFIIPLPGTD